MGLGDTQSTLVSTCSTPISLLSFTVAPKSNGHLSPPVVPSSGMWFLQIQVCPQPPSYPNMNIRLPIQFLWPPCFPSLSIRKPPVIIWFCPHFIFYFSYLFSVTWPYVTWSVTWLDDHLTFPSHDYPLIVLTFYCLAAHCPPYMGTLLSLGLLSHSLLFPLAIVFVPIVPRVLLFVLLGHLVMVAALVVYKPCLYCRRGLKPDLVS